MIDFASRALCRYPALSAFVLSILTLAPFASGGLDVTDPGFHLANQLMVGRIGLAYIVEQPYWWFSDVIGWAWLSFTEVFHLGLLGARMGGILLFATCAAIAAGIVSRHVLAHWLIPLSVLCVAPFFSSFLSLISYDSVPAFLCLIGLYLYLEAVFRAEQARAIYLWSFGAGVVFFLLLISRLPALTVLVLPVWMTIAAMFIDKRYLRTTVVVGTTVYVVVSIMSLSFYLYLASSGLLSKIQANQPLDTHYTAGFVFAVIKAQWSLIQEWCMWFTLPLLALTAAQLFRSVQRPKVVVPVLAAVVVGYVWVSYRSQLQDIFAGTLNQLLFMCLLISAMVILAAIMWHERDARSRSLLFRIIVIVGSGLTLPIIVSAGSSAGIAKLQFGSYLVPPLAVALLILIARLRSGLEQRAIFFATGVLTLLAIIFAEYHLYAHGVFRDTSDRQRLSQSLNESRLTGIQTTPERAQSVDALVTALKAKPIASGASVLVYREVPLVHYLINDLPYRNWVWPDVLPLDEIKRGLPGMCDESSAPYLVVRALEPTGNLIWGGKPHIESFAPPWQVEKYEAIDRAVAACGFQSVWKNVDFEILIRVGKQ